MQEEEIELIDILRVIWKWKKFLILGTLLCTVFASGISLFLPEIYEASAVIEPGNIPWSKGEQILILSKEEQVVEVPLLEDPASIKEVLLSGAYAGGLSRNLNVPSDHLPKFKVAIPKKTNLVKISAESIDPTLAKNALNEIILLIKNDLQRKLEVGLAPVKRGAELAQIEYENIQEKIKLVETQLTDTKKRLSALESVRANLVSSRADDAVPIAMYAGQVQENRFHYQNLQEKLQDLRAQGQKAQVDLDKFVGLVKGAAGIQVHQSPSISETPIKPKKTLIMALALMLGLMGTTLLAFFLEYLERTKAAEVA